VTGSLGRRYARALIGLAREAGTLAATGNELAQVASALAQPDVRSVVANPGIPAGTRREIVDTIVQRLGVSATVGNLVRLLADRDRLGVLPDVARAYDALVDRELGRARVTVRTAAPLPDAQRRDLEELARRLTRTAEIVVSTEVDPGLLGGVVLDIGGTVYDGSVRTQLARLAKNMVGA
jgi:F-type H+-transporting ATPase subunit delta